jgi:hypothetical protein
MSDNGQSNCFLIEVLCCRRSTYAAAVLEASVFGYGNLGSGRASGKKLAHTQRELLNILTVQFRPSRCFTLSSSRSGLAVGQTFPFCLFQRLIFNKQTLPFIPFPSASPL